MKTWYTVKDGKINDVMQTESNVNPGSEWNEISNDVLPVHGEPVDWYDPRTMQRIPDFELVKQGKRKDNRGTVYNINDGGFRQIQNLDEDIRQDETKEVPLENEPYQKWDKPKKKWVIDINKKEIAGLENEIGKLRGEISSRDWKITKAARLNKDVDDLYPGETDWYNETVAEINRLEKQLEDKLSA